MKRTILIACLLTTFAFVSNAQLLRVHSAKSVEYLQTFNPKGFESALGFNYSFNNAFRMKTGFSYGTHTMPFSKFYRFQPYFSIFYKVASFNDMFFIDIFASAKIGLQNGKNEILGKHSNLFFGESLGISIEYTVYHFFSVGALASQNIYQLNNVNSLSYSFGIFVGYNF